LPQVGVSERFLAYALKRGQIRVLDLALGVRGLLRGHTAAVTDLQVLLGRRVLRASFLARDSACAVQFCGHRPEVLCSAAQDGFVLVRLLVVVRPPRVALAAEGADRSLTAAPQDKAARRVSAVGLLSLNTFEVRVRTPTPALTGPADAR
jgi:hypothetical protein